MLAEDPEELPAAEAAVAADNIDEVFIPLQGCF
jgi:hypothetical protein